MKLAVWLNGSCVAVLTEHRRRTTMSYTGRAGAAGVPLVSVSMPVGSMPYHDRVSRPFFHGLLPEGETRRMLCYDFGLDASDDMGLLAALGRDCAGALVVQPVDDAPPPAVGNASESPAIDEADVARRLAELPLHPLGVDGRIRVSLAGIQSKLLLSQRGGRGWALPSSSLPSTHVLKPAHRGLVHSVENEAFCMNLAARSGLPAARTTVRTFAGAEVLVSERFDRRSEAGGGVVRVHQEDACQALSVLTVVPERKYEESGGPTLVRIAELLDQWGRTEAKEDLLGQVALSWVVGNADAHGKNVAFLHHGDGTVGLAPLYDVMSTLYYSVIGAMPVDSTLGMFVNGKRRMEAVKTDDLIADAVRWGLSERRAGDVLSTLLDRLPEAVGQAAEDVPGVPEQLLDVVSERAEMARSQWAQSTG